MAESCEVQDSELHNAVHVGNVALVNKLLSKGVDVDIKNHKNETPLHLAAAYGNPLLESQMLFYNGKIISIKEYTSSIKATSLHCILSQACIAMVDNLLKSGASLNERNNQGDTPLHIAVRMNRIELVIKLLDLGAELAIENNKGESPLDIACIYCNLDIVLELLNRGLKIDINNAKIQKLMFYAVSWNSTKLVNKLLETEGMNKIKNKIGETPLHFAAKNNYLSFVKLLLDNGADIEAEDNCKMTSLILAVANGHTEIIKELIKRGAKTDVKYVDGNSPLHLATTKSCKSWIQALLNQRWNVNLKNNDGTTPLHIAAKTGVVDIIKMLVEKGADIDITDTLGSSALHYAASSNQPNSITELVFSGANINLQNKRGQTPLHLVSLFKEGAPSVVEELLSLGGSVDIMNNADETPFDYASRSQYHETQNGIIRSFNPRIENSEVRSKIAKHMIKLSVAGLRGSDLNFGSYRINVEQQKQLCQLELEKIKSTLVCGNFSLHILISKNIGPCYILNENLLKSLDQVLQSKMFDIDFPIYCRILKFLFRKLKKLFYLTWLGCFSLYNLIKPLCPTLPDEIVQGIVKHLDRKEMSELVKSGLCFAPCHFALDWCKHFPELLIEGKLDQYITDSELDYLIKSDLVQRWKKKLWRFY